MNPEINPCFFNYGGDVSSIEALGKPSAVVVTGVGNRYDDAFQRARKNGAILHAYVNPLEVPDNINNPQLEEQFLINGQRPPLWPFKDANGRQRFNWPGTKLLDIRDGSAWLVKLKDFARSMIGKKLYDGFFLDCLGSRLWSNYSAWDSWPEHEKKLWTASCVGVARMLHELRVELQPDFELVHNNFWHLSPEGEKYCNGVCFENNKHGDFHTNYAKRTFAGPPFARRVLVISPSLAIAEQWKQDDNITHITLVDTSKDPATGLAKQSYMKATPPIVPYHDLSTGDGDCEERLAEAEAANAKLSAENSDLKAANAQLTEANANLELRMSKISVLSAPT